jgi:hypothetical protein
MKLCFHPEGGWNETLGMEIAGLSKTLVCFKLHGVTFSISQLPMIFLFPYDWIVLCEF